MTTYLFGFTTGLVLGLAIGGLPAKADGIAASLMGPEVAPCDMPIQTEAQFNGMVFGDNAGLYTLYLGLRLMNCGDAPLNPYDVAWYKPGDKRFYWYKPDPLPSPVPLPPAGELLAWALLMAFGIGFSRVQTGGAL